MVPQAQADALEVAALDGDSGAWSTLVQRHNQRVLVSLLARGIPLDRARELAQDTWMMLMKQQQAGKLSHLNLPGLAVVQARFLAETDRRRRAGERALLAMEGPRLEGGGTLEDEAIGRQSLARLSSAFAACPPRARMIFQLCYDNPDWGYARVAQHVGLSEQRVKQTVCEIRKRLREAIDADQSETSAHVPAKEQGQ